MWKSKKLLRVVKSAMAAETLIQVEAAEACFWLANLLSEMLYCKPNDDKNIKIECYTDNHQLYDSVYSIRPIQDTLTNRNCIIKRNDQQKRSN